MSRKKWVLGWKAVEKWIECFFFEGLSGGPSEDSSGEGVVRGHTQFTSKTVLKMKKIEKTEKIATNLLCEWVSECGYTKFECVIRLWNFVVQHTTY